MPSLTSFVAGKQIKHWVPERSSDVLPPNLPVSQPRVVLGAPDSASMPEKKRLRRSWSKPRRPWHDVHARAAAGDERTTAVAAPERWGCARPAPDHHLAHRSRRDHLGRSRFDCPRRPVTAGAHPSPPAWRSAAPDHRWGGRVLPAWRRRSPRRDERRVGAAPDVAAWVQGRHVLAEDSHTILPVQTGLT